MAQKDSSKISFGLNYHGGKILIHTPKIYAQAPPYSQALEFSYAKQTTGNAYWQQRFGFPETALNFCVAANGSSILGYSFGLYPSIQFRILGGKKSYWYFKLGGGIGVNTKAWQRTPASDSINNILGSKVNNFTLFQTGLRFKVNERFSVQSGFHFYHVSNAATRTPNYGINTLGGFVGLHYHPYGNAYEVNKKEWPKLKNPLNIGAKVAIAFAESKTSDGPIYPYYHASLFASKMYRNKSRAIVGLDATYSSELYASFKNSYNHIGREKQAAVIYSAFLAHEFVFGKIGFPLQLGFYLNRPAGGRSKYQKLGINYHVYHDDSRRCKDLFLFTQLFTENVNAQYAEVGIGFMF
jgi:hypothetical protein